MKKFVLAIVGTAAIVNALDSFAHNHLMKRLEERLRKESFETARREWREAYVLGFDHCNARVNYKIPREYYPKFD